MKVKFNVQQNGVNTLKEKFEINSNNDLKKVYMVIGNLKETGSDILEEFLIDLKARKFFIVGIDKKNTTRRMLEDLCKYTKNVYVYNNNYENELDSNIFIFEYATCAKLYTTSGSVSESSFTTDLSCYTEVFFDLNIEQDKLEYKEYIKGITQLSKSENITAIDKGIVARLVEDKQIFSTKQYIHNVLSISELMNKNTENIKQEVTEEIVEDGFKTVPKFDLKSMDEFNFDIDLGAQESVADEVETVDKNVDFEELKEKEVDTSLIEQMASDNVIEATDEYEISNNEVIDMESMLFEKADVELSKKPFNARKEDEEGLRSRKVDLGKVSNLFLELPTVNEKSKDKGQIKIPNYVKDLISNFFRGLEEAKSTEGADGINERRLNISLEIIDVNSDEKYKDSDAYISEVQGRTYIAINSEKLRNIYYEEKDLARIIKLSDNTYHIEIIPKTADEYIVWKKLCTTSMRGTNRCYGIM